MTPDTTKAPEAVAWFKTADCQPEPGNKFVALYDDGSGAWLGFAHDCGVIDSDGDDHTKMPNAEWWAYLPSGFRLSCEDHPADEWAVTLPDYVCPPLSAPAQPASQVSEMREKVARTIQGVIVAATDPEDGLELKTLVGVAMKASQLVNPAADAILAILNTSRAGGE